MNHQHSNYSELNRNSSCGAHRSRRLRLQRGVSLLLCLCMLFTILPIQVFAAETETNAHPFTDVEKESWYGEAVQYVYEHGIFSGTSAAAFMPDGAMTRGMFVAILGRMAGMNPEEYTDQPDFMDVPRDAYYAPYVIWAAKYGVAVGTGNSKFEPEALVNRQQMATFFVRYFDTFGVEYDAVDVLSTFPADLDTVADWAEAAVLELWKTGLLVGDGINFDPLGNATRAQAATLCMRIHQTVKVWYKEPGIPSAAEPEQTLNPGESAQPTRRPGGGSGGGSSSTRYYEVRFALGDGMDNSGLTLPETKTYPSKTKITELPTPYQRGYVFLGWYYDAALKERAETTDTVNKNMTLYAKMTALDEVPFAETPPYLTKQDVGTDFAFFVKAGSGDEVKQALTVTQITANNTILTETDLSIAEEGDLYKVTGSYQAGHTYRARLDENSDTVFVADGIEQPASVRELNFITAKAEVMNLRLREDLVYVPKEQVSGMSGALTGLFAVDVGVSDGIQTVENNGTFTYSGSEVIKSGDTAAIYEGVRPGERTLETDNGGTVVYVKITNAEGNIYTYTTADSEDVLFTPDVLPVLSGLDKNSGDGDILTVDKSALDFTDDKYAVMGLDAQTTIDEGDFIAFYTGDIGSQEGSLDGYVQITGVTLTESEYTITYIGVSEADVLAAMDIYSTRTESIDLTEEEAQNIEREIVSQAEASGFVDEAIDYLTYMAMETDGFEKLDGVEIVNYSVQSGEASPKAARSGRVASYENGIKTQNVSASIKAGKNVLEHFEDGDGLRAELKLEFEREIEIANGSKLTISMEAVFEQEVLLSINISGGAIWKWAWIIPYIYDYQLNANIDVGTFTGIAVTVSLVTGEGGDEDEDADSDTGNGNFLDVDWGSLVPGGNDVSVDDYAANLGTQLDKLIEKGEEFMGEDAEAEEDGGGEHPLSGLMEQYAEMMEEADDSWIELVRKEIFSIGGAVDPFHILVFGISADFVVKANVYITLGMTFEYGNAKRYNFSLMLFHRQTTNETIDLETEHYEFVFYVMGTLGIRAGVEFEIAVGLFSLKLDSIGITAEVGAYAQLWGYFYYKLSWEAGSDRKSICAGALHIEIGIYLEIKFKAQLFSSEKLTYNPTLYENQWPVFTIGEQNNVYDFNWSPGYEDDSDAEGPTYRLKSVKSFTLPTELFDMAYMDMQTGELGGRDAEDEAENPAVNCDDISESRYAIELSNPKFRYDPAQNTIEIEPDGSVNETCEMTIIWKGGTLSFTSQPVSLTVTIEWRDPENAEYIAFYSNGGSVVNTLAAVPGAEITAPEDPVKKGYAFAGWYADPACSEQPYTFPAAMPKHSTAVYAKWTPRSDTPYKTEYYRQELNGSYSLAETKELTGTTDSDAVPDTAAPAGFAYNKRKSAVNQKIAPNGSTVVKVYFDRQKYTLTFTYGDKDDGSLPNVIYRDVKYGAPIYEPKMNLGGYLFSGWEDGMTFTDADGSPTQTMPAGDTSYAASWTPDSSTPYRVEYYVQDTKEDKYYYSSARAGTGATDTAVDLTPYHDAGGGLSLNKVTVKGTEVQTGDDLLRIKGDGSLVIKLYFDRSEYEVSFDAGGGTAVESQIVRHEGKVLEPAVPARTGYTFAGWINGETVWDFGKDIVTGDITLTAKWTPNGNTAYRTEHYWQNITGGTEADYTLHAAVPMSGFTDADTAAEAIDYTADGFQSAKAFEQTTIAADGSTVVKIYYDRKTYTAAFVTDGGSAAPAEQIIRHGGSITEPADPVKIGYTFAGWKNGENLWAFDTDTVTGDLTLTASWTANSDTVYTVKHIKENLDGSYPADAAETEPLAGMTGANAAVTLKSYEGFGAGTYTNTVIAADGSTVVEVYYPRNSYTVTWLDFDGLTQLGTDIFKFEQIISVPDSAGTPVKRTGYTFTSWKDAGIMPSGDKNIQAGPDTAEWSANTYTVTFDCNYSGAPAASTGIQTYDAKYSLPAVPVRAGYAFIGWYTEAEGGVLVDDSTDVKSAEDHTLYAHWEIGTATPYIVKHWQQNVNDDAYTEITGDQQNLTGTTNGQTQAVAKTYPGFAAKTIEQQSIAADGSTVVNIYYDRNIHNAIWTVDGAVSPVTYRFGEVISKPEDPAKEHYAFTGWQGFTENMTMGDADAVFMAAWTPVKYSITYDLGGGIADNLMDYTVESGAVALTNPCRAGYTFSGWSGTGLTGSANMTVIIPSGSGGDRSYTANWTANTYTVRFSANGGIGTMADQGFAYDAAQQLAACAFMKTGYSFGGWSTEPDTAGVFYHDRQEVKNLTAEDGAVLTLYAQWTAERYTINYELDGGVAAVDNPTEYTPETPDIILLAPVRTGYTFDGWTCSELGMSEPASSLTVPRGTAGNLTIQAHWTANSYTVIFNANGGSVGENSRTVTYGAAYGPLPEPVCAGYSFTGWFTAASGGAQVTDSTTVSTDSSHTLYAHWDAEQYTITYIGLEGSDTDMDSLITKYTVTGTSFSLPMPARDGYSFTGWTCDNDGVSIEESNGSCTVTISANTTGDICITAGWMQQNLMLYDTTNQPVEGYNGTDPLPYTISIQNNDTTEEVLVAYWTTAANRTGGTRYAPGTVRANVSASVLYAVQTAPDTPMEISSMELLTILRDKVNDYTDAAAQKLWRDGHYALTADFTLDSAWTQGIGGNGRDMSGAYLTGTFDGRGHTITYDNAGDALIGHVQTYGAAADTAIRNVKVTGTIVNKTHYNQIGGVVDYVYGITSGSAAAPPEISGCIAENLTIRTELPDNSVVDTGGIIGGSTNRMNITDCHVRGGNNVFASNGTAGKAGGIIGSFVADGSCIISDCTVANAAVSGGNSAGGIAGHFKGETMDNCTVTGSQMTGGVYAGGIAGWVNSDKIKTISGIAGCGVSGCEVSGGSSGSASKVCAGGVVGYNQGILTGCTVTNSTIRYPAGGKGDPITTDAAEEEYTPAGSHSGCTADSTTVSEIAIA